MNRIKLEESKTYKLFLKLKKEGYDVRIGQHFDYSFDKNWNFLAISLMQPLELEKIFESVKKTGHSFDIKISQFVNDDKCHLTIALNKEYAEVIDTGYSQQLLGIGSSNFVINESEIKDFNNVG